MDDLSDIGDLNDLIDLRDLEPDELDEFQVARSLKAVDYCDVVLSFGRWQSELNIQMLPVKDRVVDDKQDALRLVCHIMEFGGMIDSPAPVPMVIPA